MIHALPTAVVQYPWPSIQKASQLLCLRIWAAETTGHYVVPTMKEAA